MLPQREFNHIALNPQNSVVIEACAGSGKTWLLVSRILRLLLSGVTPSEVLAITFTRKAAKEMQLRLQEWLQFLVTAPNADVQEFLLERGISASDVTALLPRARQLFEESLAAHPDITIATFHGWFLQLLQRAPLESGVSGDITLIEQTSLLAQDSWQAFANSLQTEPESETALAFLRLCREYGLVNTKSLLLSFLHKRAEWWAYTEDQRTPIEFALSELKKELGLDLQIDPYDELMQYSKTRILLNEYHHLLSAGGQHNAAQQIEWILGCDNPQEAFITLTKACLTQKGEPRKLSAKKLGDDEAKLLNIHLEVCESISRVKNLLSERKNYALNQDALICGVALLQQYQEIKAEQRVLDYSDIEWHSFKLLHDREHAEYIQYKLDSRYRHILLDEFQDTNPLQWQILKAWLSASHEAGTHPSIFLVGDPKQSIYRFRRADARLFYIAADFFEKHYAAHRLTQNISRRNAPVILNMVNHIFAHQIEYAHFQEHVAYHKKLPGMVEVIPIVASTKADNIDTSHEHNLRNPLLEARTIKEDIRHQLEARQVASKIKQVVSVLNIYDDAGKIRPAQYCDIMLLVKRRTHLSVYENALREANIPYISSRQGGLLHTLEAEDITALLSFLIMPYADLQLAHTLRSPLFGCSDNELMLVATTAGSDWWHRIKILVMTGRATHNIARAFKLISEWLQIKDRLPVHDLLDLIYAQTSIYAAYTDAVPPALQERVTANLNAFIELSLTVDAGRYPSLSRFLNELAQLKEIRDEEAPSEGIMGDIGNAVQIYTIHGAKGLEAPIVMLLDCNSTDIGETYNVMVAWPPEEPKPIHFSFYTTKAERGIKREKYFLEESAYKFTENLNLLYVAMTRAKQVFIASASETTKPVDSWYAKIQQALSTNSNGENQLLVNQPRTLQLAFEQNKKREVAHDRSNMLRLIPTGMRDTAKNMVAMQFGIRLHRLLEHLTAATPTTDKDLLQNILGVGEVEFQHLLQLAQSILSKSELQRFFDASQYHRAYNEVPYISQTNELRRIDRLVEFEDSVWILDYKAGTRREADRRTVEIYRKQLQEYSIAMRNVYTDKTLHAALLFADGELYEVDLREASDITI